MALFSTSHTAIRGLSACVPEQKEYNRDYDWISESERTMLIKTTGIDGRRVAPEGITLLDLSIPAGEALLQKLGWEKESIGMLVLVTQSRDYILPSTAILIQDRLGLPKTCAALDIGLGCSGYVYGLSVASAMLQTGGFKRALLVAGDVSTVSASPQDKSVYPLFGDAVTITALEYDPAAPKMDFNLQSDGAGYEAIIIRHGSVRRMPDAESFVMHEIEKGIVRAPRHLELNGLDVFNFSVREAPPNITALLAYNHTTAEDYDYFVMHQANKLMNETIRKKLKIPAEKTPYSLGEFGNTSSASIPLTLLTQCTEAAQSPKRWLFSGFGVGLSWGAAAVHTEKIICVPVIDYPAPR